MKSAEALQGVSGLLAALISMVLVAGSLVLSLTEGGVLMAAAPTPSMITPPAEFTPHPSETYSTQAATSMVTPVLSLTPMPSASPTASPLPPSPPASCPPPDDWSAITIQPGDTLTSLARTYNVSEALLAKANCLLTNALKAGATLYVPGYPTPVPPVVCGPPAGWVYYIVQAGDTLYRLSEIYDVTIAQLQLANCLGTSTFIREGQRLFVPFYLAPTATRTATPVIVPTSSPTLIPTVPLTSSPTSTFTLPVGFTPAPTSTSTSTLTPSATATGTPTATLTPTFTATYTQVPTSTATLTFTPLPTATSSLTATLTPLPGLSPSP